MALSMALSFFTDHFAYLENAKPEQFTSFVSQRSCAAPELRLGTLGTIYRADLACMCVFGLVYSLHLIGRSAHISGMMCLSAFPFALMHATALAFHCLTPQLKIDVHNWDQLRPSLRDPTARIGAYSWNEKYIWFALDTGFTGAAGLGLALMMVQLRLQWRLQASGAVAVVLLQILCVAMSFYGELQSPRLPGVAEGVYQIPAQLAAVSALLLHKKLGKGSKWIGLALLSLMVTPVWFTEPVEGFFCRSLDGYLTAPFWIFLACISCFECLFRYVVAQGGIVGHHRGAGRSSSSETKEA